MAGSCPATDPPARLLLWLAAVLAWIAGTPVLAAAIVAVILINAVFAFAQERHAEHAVEALNQYSPQQATVLRDPRRQQIDARELVPGDVLFIAEGDRISRCARPEAQACRSRQCLLILRARRGSNP